MADQSITIDSAFSTGSWGIARVIRRSAPWNVDRLTHPTYTYYRCARDGTGVDIYDLDTGIDTSHVEFGGRATNLTEVVSSGGAGDDHGHGTAVASAAIGATVGIARGANLFGVKVLDSSNTGTMTNIATGLANVLTHYNGRSNPAVCILPLQNSAADASVTTAIGNLLNAGMVVVSVAGNGMTDLGASDQQPAEADADIVIVGGIGMGDLPYFRGDSGTGYGTPVEILAPAQALYLARAAVSGGGYTSGSNGNSFAAPMVAGAIACMLQGHSKLTTRTQVQAVVTHLLAQATTGKLRTAWGLSPLPDKILYLNPNTTAPETIAGI